MMDKYGHEWPEPYQRADHTTGQNLERADAYVRQVLSQEEHYRVVPAAEALSGKRLYGQVDEPRPRPRKKVYHFSDRTNRPEPT